MENDFELEQVSVRLVKDSPLYNENGKTEGEQHAWTLT